ncbi:uncharacterized protein LOC133300771 [Gastrolobium bilobum]|uniref:uncharacterized protein LOC133300771 n=1 Tax=Gastrolobium bilobum TaxID=150636 RepID=UPI002AAF7332|nr:uncharacterized protein LOC133300771 [Gastrolobium bilobum]
MEWTKHTGNASNTKKSFSVTVNINSLDNVKQLSQSLPHEDRRLFTRKYGAILDLLVIPVETSALCVLAQYWNSSLRSFELPNLDITPTIEEFACMIGLPMEKESTVYFPPEHCISATKVARQFGELLGLQSSQIKLVGHADSQGLTRAFMENYLKELEQRREWVTFSRVLALTIYGLVLFSSALDMVDQAAMRVFFTVETKKINPMLAVLAETFLTLDFCQKKQKGGKLRCCAQLLYVWIITHMYAGNHINSSSDPLRSFHRIPVNHRDEKEWKIEFDSVEGKTFKWICPWFETRRGDIIYSCGEFLNVPLIGLRGCITYTPAVVLKQLGWTQKQPREEQLGGYCFSYKDDDDTKALSREIKKAWGDVRMAGRLELGKREARRTSNNTLKAPARGKDSPQSTPQMVEQLELMRAQIPFLVEQKKKAEL